MSESASPQANIDAERFASFGRILQHHSDTIQGFLDYALGEAILLTSSTIGYIYFYDSIKEEFILNSWSKGVMRECAVTNQQSRYELSKTGLWGEAVRQGKTILVNDYTAPDPLKKGYPEGHVHLARFLTVPVFDEGSIVAVIGVANKAEAYDDGDARQLSLLMEAIWKIVVRKRAEESLAVALMHQKQVLSELEHRIKNSFAVVRSIISLEADVAECAEAKESLDRIGARVESFAELYDVLSRRGGSLSVSLEDYLREVFASLCNAYIRDSGGIHMVFDAEPVSLDAKRAALVGLIVTELMTNAVKYAFPGGMEGTFSLCGRVRDEFYAIEIGDDGVGMAATLGAPKVSSRGLGTRLVPLLLEQLGAKKVDLPGPGTRIRLEFPLDAK